jgi:hypothetical protein
MANMAISLWVVKASLAWEGVDGLRAEADMGRAALTHSPRMARSPLRGRSKTPPSLGVVAGAACQRGEKVEPKFHA